MYLINKKCLNQEIHRFLKNRISYQKSMVLQKKVLEKTKSTVFEPILIKLPLTIRPNLGESLHMN